jgi:peptidoglycan/xylan/chitin deacetylase (PgdA/CDA1 family)
MYVPSGLLGARGYMTRDQVVEMHRTGISIGAHSRSHADLRRCTETELEAEVRGCREDLEALLGGEVTLFAYPYGSEDGRVRRAVMKAGYRSAVTARRGWTRPGCDPFRVPRNFIEQFDLRVFRAATQGGLNLLAPLDAVRSLCRR